MSPSPTLAQRNPSWLNWLFALFMALMLAATLAPGKAQAAPAVGTSIGNQAAATYTDASLVSRNVTSNTVSTIVAQVASFTLNTTGQIKTGSPGGTVYFSHYLTNTGNGTDTFTLTTANLTTTGFSSFNIGTITMYADANGDGVPDSATPIPSPGNSTGALAAGGIFRFVVAATVPGTATNGQIDQLSVNAQGDPAATGGAYTAASPLTGALINIDQINVSGNAVINVTKAISASSGTPSPTVPTGPYTYTLTYTNTGNSPATNLTLTDVIDARWTIVSPNSGTWSVTGATTLTNAPDGTVAGGGTTINYSVSSNTVTAVIGSVPVGTSGSVTISVNLNAAVAPTVINNLAGYEYHDGVAPITGQNTNTVGFTVNQYAAVSAVSPALTASAAQGSTVPFLNEFRNDGNATDSFDITVAAILTANNTFPAGTTFQLFQNDGVTPLVDTNGNGTPDTGPVAPGATYNVFLMATLPTNAIGGPFSVRKTATSRFNSAISAFATDTLQLITASVVDLTNNTARSTSTPAGTATAGNATTQPGATGFGSTTTTVITTNTINPGTTTPFTLFVNNVTGPADSYNLTAAITGSPVGWSVVFRERTLANAALVGTGAIITNTGTINAGSNKLVFADVTVAANASPGTTTVDFTVTSATTTATDVKRDEVTVNTINSVMLTPNNSGQVFPGGSVVYGHQLTNIGNVSQAITFPAGYLTDSQVAAGWTSVLYRDTGGTTLGVFDATDPVVLAAGFNLAAGVSETLWVKVFAPAGAAIGTANTTTVTATYGAFTASATDTTTVIGGQVTLSKLQALDADCNGVADVLPFISTNITAGAIPGACIRYQVTATNVGSTDVTTLVVSDGTPANTTYNNGSPTCAGTAIAATTVGTIGSPTPLPACGAAGTISANVGTLTPGQTSIITFGVRINP